MGLRHLACGLVAAWFAWNSAVAETIVLQPNAPERHVVAQGDTLWDISSKFLRDPWLWPEIWQVNPNIANPHLIYPGDTIFLSYDKNGRPILSLERGPKSADGPIVKLSPEARPQRIEDSIPTIPLDAINQFLTNAGVMSKEEYEMLPYIVSFEDERMIAGANDKAYIRGLSAESGNFGVVRQGPAYRDPGAKGDEILGYEVLEVGTVRITRPGDPATGTVMDVTRELMRGDRLIPLTAPPLTTFMPRAAPGDVEGLIIAVIDGVSRIGLHHVVVLNVGESRGIEPGHVFAVYQTGRIVDDPFAKKRGSEKVALPDEQAGHVMVFRVFERVSYALVTNATREIRIHDGIKKP